MTGARQPIAAARRRPFVALQPVMYLNVNLANSASNNNGGGGQQQQQQHPSTGSSGAQPAGTMGGSTVTAPDTPDILNLLTGGPFDNLMGPSFSGSIATSVQQQSYQFQPSCSTAIQHCSASSTPGDGPSSPGDQASSSFSSFSSLCSSPSTPPGQQQHQIHHSSSVQNTRTYLIKEGLKLTIQSKRLASGRSASASGQAGSSSLMLLDSPASGDPRQFHHHHNSSMSSPGQLSDQMHMLGGGHLTSEDEERRRRRRERNKVAATKCRNRKKERTGILMQESDVLEDQNVSFRSEIQRLESEKRRLMDVLAMHSTNCNLTSQKVASGSSSTSAGGVAAAGANSSQTTTPVSCSSSDYVVHQDPTNMVGAQTGSSHYTNMTSAPPSSYNQVMYDCRSTSESSSNTMVGGSTNMSHQQHHVLNYGDDGNLLESSGMVDFQTNASSSSSSYSQVHHRLSYSGDNNPSSNNYR